jgi:predicted Zn-ribbon and HTH transcriptional regulator
MIACQICQEEFEPRESRNVICKSSDCKRVNRNKTNVIWHRKTGRVDGTIMNYWSDEDEQFLRDNRYLSTGEIAEALDRADTAVRAKRCKMNLPRLAKCSTCGVEFKRINQHEQCISCTPSQMEYEENYRKNLNGKWQQYKNNAKKRNLAFNLTLHEFGEYWQEPCSYCGSGIETIGVDRVDSSLGYTVENTVSCCFTCNEMKMTRTKAEWVDHMKKTLTFLGEI